MATNSSMRAGDRAAPFAGRHVAITGASSGVGAALARVLSSHRSVLLLIGRNETRLASVAAECTAAGATVQVAICDVTNQEALATCLLGADSRLPIDVVIANAGIGGEDAMAPACGESAAQARSIFETNTMGVIHTCAPLLDRMVRRRSGHLVIVSSIMAYRGLADAPVYAASKAAARVYGQGLSALLAPHGVKVLVACPGFVDTPMSRSLPFKKPFMVTAERAAERILSAVSSGRREIAFPWQLSLATRAANFFPARIVDPVLQWSRDRLARHS